MFLPEATKTIKWNAFSIITILTFLGVTNKASENQERL